MKKDKIVQNCPRSTTKINFATLETIFFKKHQKCLFYLIMRSLYGANVKIYFTNIFLQTRICSKILLNKYFFLIFEKYYFFTIFLESAWKNQLFKINLSMNRPSAKERAYFWEKKYFFLVKFDQRAKKCSKSIFFKFTSKITYFCNFLVLNFKLFLFPIFLNTFLKK